MLKPRRYSLFDKLIHQSDGALRTLANGHPGSGRPAPHKSTGSETAPNLPTLTSSERRQVAGMMRVNHTGEVCAQALYQGQAVTARLPRIKRQMEQSAIEEMDHLAWCHERLQELNSHPSVLNPLWYWLSFGIGAAMGKVGDRWSLGFVEETEHQVCAHIDRHLARMPEQDHRTQRILTQMREDELHHADKARQAGAVELPAAVKSLMAAVAKIMTTVAYRI